MKCRGWREGEQGAGLHVSCPSVAGVSLALDKSESDSRLAMRSSSAWTSLRPSFEPTNVSRDVQIGAMSQSTRSNKQAA